MTIELTKEEKEKGKFIYWVKIKKENGKPVSYTSYTNYHDAKTSYDNINSENVQREKLLESKTV